MSGKKKTYFDTGIEYDPRESTCVLKNSLFTNIIKSEIHEVPLAQYAPCLFIINEEYNLNIQFSQGGVISSIRDFKTAMRILKNSMMYN